MCVCACPMCICSRLPIGAIFVEKRQMCTMTVHGEAVYESRFSQHADARLNALHTGKPNINELVPQYHYFTLDLNFNRQ